MFKNVASPMNQLDKIKNKNKTGLKILRRVGTHIIFFSGKEYNFIHFAAGGGGFVCLI